MQLPLSWEQRVTDALRQSWLGVTDPDPQVADLVRVRHFQDHQPETREAGDREITEEELVWDRPPHSGDRIEEEMEVLPSGD